MSRLPCDSWGVFFFCAAVMGAVVGGCAPGETPLEPLPARATVGLEHLAPAIPVPTKAPVEPLDELAKKAIDQAEQLIAAGKARKGVQLLTQAVDEGTDHPRFRRTLGLGQIQLKQNEEARKNLSRAAQLDSDDLDVQLALGKLAIGAKQYQEAILTLRVALSCTGAVDEEPTTGEALLLLAQQLHAQGYWTASLQCYRKLCTLIEQHDRRYASNAALKSYVFYPQRLLLQRGLLLSMLRRPAEAAEPLETAFRRDRSDPQTAPALIKALGEAGQFDRAEDLLDQMVSEPTQRSQLPAMTAMLAEQITRATKPQRAARLIARVVATKQDTPQIIEPALEQILAAAKGTEWILDFAQTIAGDQAGINYALHYVAGRILAANRLNDEAIRQMQLAIASKGDFSPAYEYLVDIYLAHHDAEKLEALTKQIMKIWPDSHFTHYIQGKVDLARGRPTEALAQLQKARRLNKDHPPTLVQLSRAYAKTGQIAQAAKTLYDAMGKDPDDQSIYRYLFDLWSVRGDYTRARDTAQRLLKRDSHSIRGKTMLGEAQLGLGHRKEALELIEQLKKDAPQDLQVKMLSVTADLDLAEGLPSKSAFDEALRALEQMARDHDDDRPRRMKAQLLSHVGSEDQAAAVLGEIHRRKPTEIAVAEGYVTAMTKTGRYEEALQIVERMLSSGAGEQWRRMALNLLDELDRPQEAWDRGQEWLAKAPQQSKPYYKLRLIQLAEKTEQYAPAQQMLDEMIETSEKTPTRTALEATKLGLYVLADQDDEAIRYAETWAERSGDALGPRTLLASALGGAERHEQAHRLLDRWIGELGEDNTEKMRILKINLYCDIEQFDQAVTYAQSWVRLAPGRLFPRVIIIAALLDGEQYDRASQLVDEWLTAPPTTAPAAPPTQPASAATTQATRPSAATGPTTTTATAPSTQATRPTTLPVQQQIRRWSQEMAVRLTLLRGEPAEALRQIRRYRRRYPDSIELLGLKATVLSELGREAQAIDAAEQAHQLNEDDALLCNNLGYFYADKGIKLAQAEQLIRKALSERGDELSFLDSLGWVFYKTGRIRRAAALFMRITRDLHEQDMDPVIFDHAGDAYYRLGWSQKAVTMWELATDAGADKHRPSAEIRRMLQVTDKKIRAVRARRRPDLAPVHTEDENHNNKQQR